MKKRGMLLAVGLCAIALGSCVSGQRPSVTPEESTVSSPSEKSSSNEGDEQIRQIYDMYLANGGTMTYEEWLASIKGEKGEKGDPGEKGDKGDDGQTPYIGFNGNWWIGSQDTGIPAKGDKGDTGDDGETPYIGENGDWWVGGRDTGVSAKGEKGDKGEDGKTYEAVVSVEKKSSDGNVDTYVITYADGKTYEFTVTNGKDGEQGIQGEPGEDGHTPKIEVGENGDWYVDGEDTGVKARGEKGDTGERGPQGEKGDQGKSAYELYKEAHPEYAGDEEQWLSDLESGKLRKITVAFDSDGGSEVAPVSTTFGSYVKVGDPTKDGYDFAGWSLNGSVIDINTYVFFADCTLVATWREAQYIRVAFDPNDGVVAPGHTDIEYGKEYTLPTPSKEYQTFKGWKYGDTDIPLTGTWEYTHRDITLTASWEANTKVYVNLSVDAKYGSVSTAKVTLAQGDFFTLEAPSSIKDGYTFYGWYLGDERITDESGHSLGVCKWDTTQTLTASYFIKISTIYQFMELGGQNLYGNYLVTQDLDFKGLGVNSIKSFAGTFDFGEHALKNFELLSGATSDSPSGLFKTIRGDATIKNLTLENASCSQTYASGLIGALDFYSTSGNAYYSAGKTVYISNVNIIDSFNTEMVSPFVAFVRMRPYLAGDSSINYGYQNVQINVSCVRILDSGLASKSYLFGYLDSYDDSTVYRDYGINLQNIDIKSAKEATTKAGVIYMSYGWIYRSPISSSIVRSAKIEIGRFNLDSRAQSGICYSFFPYGSFGKETDYLPVDLYKWNRKYSSGNGEYHFEWRSNISVSASMVNKAVLSAWGGVETLVDSSNSGSVSDWGADENLRVVDRGREIGNYTYGVKQIGANVSVTEEFDFSQNKNPIEGLLTSYYCKDSKNDIKSSINLYPDANGAYTYWSQSGNSTTLSDASLINKDFFVSLLGFDETIWNLDQINVADKAYPVLR